MQEAATTVILILFLVSMIVVERVLSVAERKAKAEAEARSKADGIKAEAGLALAGTVSFSPTVSSPHVAGDLFNLAQSLGRPVAAESSADVSADVVESFKLEPH